MRQRKILVMEHDEREQRLLRLLINRLGFEPRIACNEDECLLTAKRDLPDLLLINTDLPLAEGMLNMLREDGRMMKIPSIAIVGSAPSLKEINGLLAQGFTGHISRPLNISGLDEAIQRALSGA